MHVMVLLLARVTRALGALCGAWGNRSASSGHIHRPVVWASLLAAVLAAGCSKEETEPGDTTTTNAAQAGAAAVAPAAPPSPRGPGPAPTPARPAVISDAGDQGAILAQLSTELRKYVVRTRSVPKNFEEFAAKSRVQVPSPPPGKKYAIKDQAVVLVNR
jgi:hypothetical protein